MARYGAGVTAAGVNTANVAYFNLDNTNTTKTLSVVEVIVEVAVLPTTAPVFALARTTTRGTQASTLAGLPHDTAAAGATGTLDVCGTGASQPTFTNTNRIRIAGLPLTLGYTFIWTFYDAPIIVPATLSNGLALFNVNASGATTGTFYCSFAWDE